MENEMSMVKQRWVDGMSSYLSYVHSTGQIPLPVQMFDVDWGPIAPVIRQDLEEAGLIKVSEEGIVLTEAAKETLF